MEANNQRFRSIKSRANCWRVRKPPASRVKNPLSGRFPFKISQLYAPTYTRWKLKLNFFDVCHLTYVGLLAQLHKWSLQYGRRELLPASFSECRLLDPVLFLRSVSSSTNEARSENTCQLTMILCEKCPTSSGRRLLQFPEKWKTHVSDPKSRTLIFC